MPQALGICAICSRQVLDNGQCLYCTTAEALEVDSLLSEAYTCPPPDKVMKLVETSTGRIFVLDTGRVRIGRDPKELVVLDDPYVSRHHAFIVYEEDQYWIVDLGSKNGSLLNGAHILEREALSPGDTLTIGHTDFQVV
jgi:hypothetical protein